jgi:predicted sulfurtransferase
MPGDHRRGLRMIKRFAAGAALALVFLLPALASAKQNVEQAAALPRISQKDFQRRAQAGELLVLDIRDAGSYAAGHIPGAVLMPEATLEKHVAELKASKKTIVTYCS